MRPINSNLLVSKKTRTLWGGTTYNIAAAEDWAPGADASTDIADLTGNAITVSNVAAPTSPLSYATSAGALTITEPTFRLIPEQRTISIFKLTLTGAAATHTHSLLMMLNLPHQPSSQSPSMRPINSNLLVSAINGTSSGGGTTYNIAAAEDRAGG